MKDSNYIKLNQDEKVEKSIWDSKEVVISEGNIFIDGKQYIPDNMALKREIVKKLHDTLPLGHPGELETLNKVSDVYWWPGMMQFVKNYVKGCPIVDNSR